MEKKAGDKGYFEKRPWGSYEILHVEQAEGFQVKRIEVNPGERLSLQKHEKRREIWTVVSGEGLATVGHDDMHVKVGTVIRIPAESIHRMTNTGTKPLIFVEIQLGSYLGEDDIIRIQDDYNRK